MPWVRWASSEQSVNQWIESKVTLREELEGQNDPSNAQRSQCSLTYLCVPHHQLGIRVLSFEVEQFSHGWSLDPGHTLPFKTQLLLGSVFQPLGSIVSLLRCLLRTTLPLRNRITSAVGSACLLTCLMPNLPNWEGRVHAKRKVRGITCSFCWPYSVHHSTLEKSLVREALWALLLPLKEQPEDQGYGTWQKPPARRSPNQKSQILDLFHTVTRKLSG